MRWTGDGVLVDYGTLKPPRGIARIGRQEEPGEREKIHTCDPPWKMEICQSCPLPDCYSESKDCPLFGRKSNRKGRFKL